MESPFLTAAKEIGRNLSLAFGKLSQLSRLVDSANPFRDMSAEINQLTFHIKQNVTTLQRQIGSLKAIAADNRSMQRTQLHENVVSILQDDLGDLTKRFQEVLERRSNMLKSHQKGKERLFGVSALERRRSRRPAGASEGASSAKVFATHASNEPLFDFEEDEENREAAISIMPSQSQLQQHAGQEYQYSASRADAMETIESTLHDLANIFTEIGRQLTRHGEQLQRIDTNVLHTESNLEGAQEKLLTYWSNMKGDRWLYFKVFGLVTLFIFIFVVFFV